MTERRRGNSNSFVDEATLQLVRNDLHQARLTALGSAKERPLPFQAIRESSGQTDFEKSKYLVLPGIDKIPKEFRYMLTTEDGKSLLQLAFFYINKLKSSPSEAGGGVEMPFSDAIIQAQDEFRRVTGKYPIIRERRS